MPGRKALGKIALILLVILIPLVVISGCSGAGDGDEKSAKPAAEDTGKNDEKKQESAEGEQEKSEPSEKEKKVTTDNITVNTQSSIRINGSKVVYADPYNITKEAEDADLLLITHAHYDHFDAPSIKNVVKDKTVVICPQSMESEVNGVMQQAGVKYSLAAIEAGSEYVPTELSKDISILAFPAYNTDKSFHKKEYGWLGYVLTLDGNRYYIAGDTDVIPEHESAAMKDIDVAFVPIGGTYTMDAKQAAGLINEIGPKYAIPVHYGSIVGSAKDFDTFKGGVEEGIEVTAKVEDAK